MKMNMKKIDFSKLFQRQNRNEFADFSNKHFRSMTETEKDDFLKAGAKEFSKRFGKTIKILANE